MNSNRHPGESRGPVFEPFFKNLFKAWIPAFAGMTTLILPYIVSASLVTDSPDEAIAKIEAMVEKKQKDKKTINELTAALKSEEAGVRLKERAAWALGELEARSASPALVEAAKNKGLLVRSAALNALIRMRARSALPTYLDIAQNDPILSLRQNAAIAIGLLEWDKAIEALVKLAEAPTPEVRGAAVLGMGAAQSQQNDFTEAIKQMQGDENPYVQERAKKAMDVAKRKNATVLTHLESSDMDIRLFAALYFHRHGTGKELKTLQAAWNSEADGETRYELGQAVKAIKKRQAQAARPSPKKAK